MPGKYPARKAAWHWLAMAAWCVAMAGGMTVAQENPPSAAADEKYFEEHVRPLLAERCFKCHGAEKQKGKLRLDSRANILAGGESGPAIEPGKPTESLLVEAIRYESFEMPPDGRLADEQVAVLERWIERGAPWPGDDGRVRPIAGDKPRISDADRAYWAFQPVKKPPLPVAASDSDWCRNEIDQFLLQKLQREGIEPAAAAEPLALIRRLSFDLTGLPPTPAEIDAFLADTQPGAYERLVDRLLDSPRYGERWARHWLDLVRYAESDGYKQDEYRPHTWRYRDYVIRSFNSDKPYDRFVREQLAGDEIAPHDPEMLAATSYLRLWIYEYNQRDVRTQWDNILIDITNVTADAFLGLGMGCARCHDHKFDPILQQDYYRLKAFFTPLLPRDDISLATADEWQTYQQRLTEWESQTADLRRQIDEMRQPFVENAMKAAIKKFPPDIRPMIAKPAAERSPLEHQLAELAGRQIVEEITKLDIGAKLKGNDEAKARWEALQAELAKFDAIKPAKLPPAFTVTDVGAVAPPTAIAGVRDAAAIEPGFLTVLNSPPPTIVPPPSGNSTGRRTALADWIANKDNPLTARVIVNRIWQQHFGIGLVATASDFGRLGEPPSHPDLLDWLAATFVEDGWRFKPLHRRIVTSAAYRQTALRPAPQIAKEKDPTNRWLWRMNVRRLDAEQIRDAILVASGELSHHDGGPSVDPASPWRSIYCKVRRNDPDPLLDVFDVADGFSSTDVRNITTTPTQSLLMINGPWPLARAKKMATQLIAKHPGDERRQIETAYRLAYGRMPADAEREAAVDFLHRQTGEAVAAAKQTEAEAAATALADFCHILLNSNEFLYVD